MLQLFFLTPVFVHAVLGSLLLLQRGNHKISRAMFGLYLFARIAAYSFFVLRPSFPIAYQVVGGVFTGLVLTQLEPLLFLAFLSIVLPLRSVFRRYWYFLFPSLLAFLSYALVYLSYPMEARMVIASHGWHDNAIAAYPAMSRIQWTIDIIYTAISFLYLVIYIKVLWFDFRKYVRNNFSNNRYLNMQWIIYLALLLVVSVFCYTWLTTDHSSMPVLIPLVCMEVLFAYLVYFVFATDHNRLSILQSYLTDFIESEQSQILVYLRVRKNKVSKILEGKLAGQKNVKEELSTKVLEYFSQSKPYLNPELTLEDLVRELNTNRTYLSNLLARQLSSSFYDFVNTYRIEEAKQRMQQQPNLSLRGISQNCGFQSYATFFKYFERKEGCSPTRWRDQLAKAEEDKCVARDKKEARD